MVVTEEKIIAWKTEKDELLTEKEKSETIKINRSEIEEQKKKKLLEKLEKKIEKHKERNRIRVGFEIIVSQATDKKMLLSNETFSSQRVTNIVIGDDNKKNFHEGISTESIREAFNWSRSEIEEEGATKKKINEDESLEISFDEMLLDEIKKLKDENKSLKNQLKVEKDRAKGLEEKGNILFRGYCYMMGGAQGDYNIKKSTDPSVVDKSKKTGENSIKNYLKANSKEYREKNLINWREWKSITGKPQKIWKLAENNLVKWNREINNELNAHQEVPPRR